MDIVSDFQIFLLCSRGLIKISGENCRGNKFPPVQLPLLHNNVLIKTRFLSLLMIASCHFPTESMCLMCSCSLSTYTLFFPVLLSLYPISPPGICLYSMGWMAVSLIQLTYFILVVAICKSTMHASCCICWKHPMQKDNQSYALSMWCTSFWNRIDLLSNH